MRYHSLPPGLAGIVRRALRVCDRTEYFVHGRCRSCQGTLSGYDKRSRRFAVLYHDDGEYRVEIILNRAYCRECGRIWMPGEPFYPGTRMGSPVVDLCRALSRTMTCGQVATRLGQMGVLVDRWTVRSYCAPPFLPPPTIPAFGMNIPISVVSLSTLAGSKDYSGRIRGDDVLAACFYPTVQGIPDTSPESVKDPGMFNRTGYNS